MRSQMSLIALIALAGCVPVLAADDGWRPAAPPEMLLADWLAQDQVTGVDLCFTREQSAREAGELVAHVLEEIPVAEDLRARLVELLDTTHDATDPRWEAVYLDACRARRAARLAGLQMRFPLIIYTRHFNLGGSHYAYTEAQSDAQHERNFVPGAALCLLRLGDQGAESRALLSDEDGVIRDPDVSYDGRRILFAWKQSDWDDDYHLYEMDAATGAVRQITSGAGVADYEGIYLPGGDLLFSSTRCVQIVDCWWTEVSNLYTCDPQGRFLRRLGYDQVHTNAPQVLPDGRVVYTRWDYNDRGQIFPQALFQMNPDGTGQTEFYGNNSWFPTTIIHARGVPGSDLLVATLTGHHSDQSGKLALLDRNRGQQENAGVQLICPVRDTPADRIDSYGQEGDQLDHAYPLSEREFLVSYAPSGHEGSAAFPAGRFGIYWMDVDGRRELLAWDVTQSSNQPIPLAPRPEPTRRASAVDYRQDSAVYALQDIYAGPGLQGVERGAIKRLRVVALGFRPAGIGMNTSGGPGGGALSSTPVSVGNGAWDVKEVLGEVPVSPEGSVCFRVPACTPVYFQALDDKRQVVQTMRTWSTLQPGERMSCVGCHEKRNNAPASARLAAEPLELEPFHGPRRGFSFIQEVQPILDRHCVACHRDSSQRRAEEGLAPDPETVAGSRELFASGGAWRYTTAQPPDGWEQPGFATPTWMAGVGDFGLYGTPGLHIRTVWDTPDIWLRRSVELPPGIEGREVIARVIHDEDMELYINGELAATGTYFIVEPAYKRLRRGAVRTLHAGLNTLAVHCHQTIGGQGISVMLLDAGVRAPAPEAPPEDGRPRVFSLLGTQTTDPVAQRNYSDSYLALTHVRRDEYGAWQGISSPLVNWVGAQSVPEMLPPYFAGAATSRLMTMLDQGHQGVQLDARERDLLAAWIDLNIPYCGDYTEAAAWSEADWAKYRKYLDKRLRLEAEERANVEAFIAAGQGQ